MIGVMSYISSQGVESITSIILFFSELDTVFMERISAEELQKKLQVAQADSVYCVEVHSIPLAVFSAHYGSDFCDGQICNVDDKYSWHCQINSGPSGGAVSVFVQTDPNNEDFNGFLDYRVL